MVGYDPFDHYWRAADGRLFGSARQGLVPADDAAFAAWSECGGLPTAWPKDEAGAQTAAALQAVLDPYGLFADLAAYAAAKRYAVENGGVEIGGVPFATDDRAKTLLLGARLAAQADPSYATTWYAADGTAHTLKAADIVAISNAVLAHVAEAFKDFGAALAGIHANPPTITSRAEVDAAFAPAA